MVRIAHMADTHLGFKQYNLDEREKDIYDVLDEMGDKILEEHVDIVIHSGDLFDTPRPTTPAYYAFKKFLKRLDGRIKFLAVLGDHDKPKIRSMPPHRLFDDQIQTLGVSGTAEHQELSLDGQKVLVAGISNLSRTYRPVLVEELKRLGNLKTGCDCSVLVLHEAIDKFFPFEDSYEIALTELPKNFNYYAMGHLHSRIRTSHGQGELAYPGSSEVIRSDEIAGWKKLGKGFYIADVNGGAVKVTAVNLERIRPQFEVKLNYVRFEEELDAFIRTLNIQGKLPVVHVQVDGKGVNRQGVHQALNEALAGKVLTFRQTVIEQSQMQLPELKPGAFHTDQMLSDCLRDKEVSQLAIEMLKRFKQGDTEGARVAADEYFSRVSGGVRKSDTEPS